MKDTKERAKKKKSIKIEKVFDYLTKGTIRRKLISNFQREVKKKKVFGILSQKEQEILRNKFEEVINEAYKSLVEWFEVKYIQKKEKAPEGNESESPSETTEKEDKMDAEKTGEVLTRPDGEWVEVKPGHSPVVEDEKKDAEEKNIPIKHIDEESGGQEVIQAAEEERPAEEIAEPEQIAEEDKSEDNIYGKKLSELQSEIENDFRELAELKEKAGKWNDMIDVFRNDLEQANQECSVFIPKAKEIFDGFPDHIKEKIANRQKGLELILKMLSKLQEKASGAFPEVSAENWNLKFTPGDINALIYSEDASKEKIISDIGKKADLNYEMVAEARSSSEKLRKKFFSFIERQFLVVVDSVEDGRKHSSQLIRQLTEESDQKTTDKIQAWYRIYSDLYNSMIRVLKNVNIVPIRVEVGSDFVDYEIHEPFEVEEDENLEDEQIKEVTRTGYEYLEKLFGNRNFVVRPAQVVVVKNS